MTRFTLILFFVGLFCFGCGDDQSSNEDSAEDSDSNETPDADADTDPDTDADADTDSGSATDTGPLRIQVECAHGEDVGDCNQAFTGTQDGTELESEDTIVGYFDAGDFVSYDEVDLEGIVGLVIDYAKEGGGGSLEVRIDAVDGQIIGLFEPEPTGAWETRAEAVVTIAPIGGVHDLFLVGADAEGIINMDWFDLVTSLE